MTTETIDNPLKSLATAAPQDKGTIDTRSTEYLIVWAQMLNRQERSLQMNTVHLPMYVWDNEAIE